MKHLSLIAVLALMFTGTAVAEGVGIEDIKCKGVPTCDKAIDSPTLPDTLAAEHFHQNAQ
ncbi:hypothetical protein [Marinobacter caseinilyticus]|uniref:hypothetical protein n=1 Tax=Marinobacter caseinilyticus TaxID=2692195 RepID=UPI00140D41C0|nr:hypothetical protein [Marinobacter caseinilyticus]